MWGDCLRWSNRSVKVKTDFPINFIHRSQCRLCTGCSLLIADVLQYCCQASKMLCWEGSVGCVSVLCCSATEYETVVMILGDCLLTLHRHWNRKLSLGNPFSVFFAKRSRGAAHPIKNATAPFYICHHSSVTLRHALVSSTYIITGAH